MALHLLALVKLKLLATTGSSFNLLFPCLVYPFVLKVCIGLRYDLPQIYASTTHFSRFFLFRIGHIVFHGRNEGGFGSARRWRRALQLVGDLVDDIINLSTPTAADSPPSSNNVHSMHTYGMITLWCTYIYSSQILWVPSTSLQEEQVSNFHVTATFRTL